MAAASIPSNGSVQLPVPSSIEPGHYHQQNGGTFPSSPFTAPPGGRSPPAKNAIRLVHDRLRRQSYDVRVLNPNGTIAPNHLRPQRTASARLNPSFTSPSLASTLSIGSLTAKRRASHTVSFGFASAGFYVRRGPNDEEWLEEFEFECERPSTSQSVNEEEECGCDVPAIVAATDEEKEGAESAVISISRNGGMPSHQPSHQYRSRNLARNSQPMALFLLRHADHRILPVYCYRPQGAQADQFIHQSLTERNREAIQRFLEKEHPEEGECYLWVLDDVTMKTTVLSLTLLQNHFKSEHIRRVKWRHLSMDKVSIYRYSLPVITTKFRLRVAHFLARHYRCCILGVWCLVILCISIGIVLSVVFGSAPGAQKMPPNAVPIQPVVHQRSGGFMEEAMEMEQASSRTDGPSPLADRKPPDSVSSQHISAMNTLHGLKRRRRRRK